MNRETNGLVSAILATIAVAAGCSTETRTTAPDEMGVGATASFARSIGGSGATMPEDILTLEDGTRVVAGYFTESLYIPTATGSDTVSIEGDLNLFVAAFAADGSPLWLSAGRGAGSAQATALCRDGGGGFYLAGLFTETVTLEGRTLVSNGDFDFFVARFDASGFLMDAFTGGGAGRDYVNALALDLSGNLILGGTFGETMTLGDVTLAANGDQDGFVARCTPTWEFVWAKALGSSDDGHVRGVAVDGSAVYAAGSFKGSVTLAGETHESEGITDAVLLQADPADGDVRWAFVGGGESWDWFGDCAARPDGGVAVTGQSQSDAWTQGSTFDNVGPLDFVVGHFNSAGTPLWLRNHGGSSRAFAYDVGVTADGTTLVAGAFEGTIAIGSDAFSSLGPSDLFVATYSIAGLAVETLVTGGLESDRASALSVTDGWLTLALAFGGASDFFGIPFTTEGIGDAVVLQRRR